MQVFSLICEKSRKSYYLFNNISDPGCREQKPHFLICSEHFTTFQELVAKRWHLPPTEFLILVAVVAATDFP